MDDIVRAERSGSEEETCTSVVVSEAVLGSDIHGRLAPEVR
jgi:hypothetical protein